MWLCQCDCGKQKIALGYDLTHGRTVSCGCNLTGKPSPKREDLTGKKYSRLTVLGLNQEKTRNGILVWDCQCDCGKITTVRGYNLKNGNVKSCGCYFSEIQHYNDLTGRKYGRLTVVENAGYVNGKISWKCRCDCGNEKIVPSVYLSSGSTKSCGCLYDENSKKPHNLHPKFKNRDIGISNSRIYKIYRGMIGRCRKNYYAHKRYYDRGIKVCDEWLGKDGFYNFYEWAIDNGYSEDLTIDRINNDGNYEPSNCRWVTMKEQENNRSDNVIIKYMGEEKTLKQWCEYLGLSYEMVRARKRRGFTVPRLFEPPHKNQYC